MLRGNGLMKFKNISASIKNAPKCVLWTYIQTLTYKSSALIFNLVWSKQETKLIYLSVS